MRRALLLTTLLSFGALGCPEGALHECPASAGAAGTCAEACKNLGHLDCRPGGDQDECVAACEASGAGVPAAVLGRVLSCYAEADSCREVDGCSRTCGDGDGPVLWNLDAGIDTPDAGQDAGQDAAPDGG